MGQRQIYLVILICVVFLIVGVGSIFLPHINFLKNSPDQIQNLNTNPQTTPLPTTPPVESFKNITNTYGFAYPASWSARPVQISEKQYSQLFAACSKPVLAINEYLNTLQTPQAYLKLKETDYSSSTIDGHAAIVGSDDTHAFALIQDTPNKQLVELIYTPACGETIELGKSEQFYPLLHSFTFASSE